MIRINKKIVVDEEGKPEGVLITWEDFKQIEELLGLDLDEGAVKDLRQAQRDRESGKRDAYLSLDEI